MVMLVVKNIMVMYISKMELNLLELQSKSGTNIRVFESREASISGVNVPVARTVRQDQTIRTRTPQSLKHRQNS